MVTKKLLVTPYFSLCFFVYFFVALSEDEVLPLFVILTDIALLFSLFAIAYTGRNKVTKLGVINKYFVNYTISMGIKSKTVVFV